MSLQTVNSQESDLNFLQSTKNWVIEDVMWWEKKVVSGVVIKPSMEAARDHFNLAGVRKRLFEAAGKKEWEFVAGWLAGKKDIYYLRKSQTDCTSS